MIVIWVTLTLRQLRALIREEVERNMRWSAGFCGVGGIGAGSPRKGTEFPPQGLGDEGEDKTENEYEEEQEPSQFAARVDKRNV